MVVFLFIVYQIFKNLYFEKNNQIKLILIGSISIILFQTLIHIGVNIRLFQTTGMTTKEKQLKKTNLSFFSKKVKGKDVRIKFRLVMLLLQICNNL